MIATPLLRGPTAGDGPAVAALSVAALVFLLVTPMDGPVQEDAAMLMRYAGALADGHGMVWNVGEAPVDGATDFLFAVVLAGLHALGVGLEVAVRGLIVVAWLVTVAVVYVAARAVHGAGPLTAVVAAVPLVVGPARLYAAAGFGAPFFGLWAATSALLVLLLLRAPGSRRWSVLLGVSVLLLGLTRPEGVLLAVFLAAGVVVVLGPRRAAVALREAAAVFVVAGAVYFLWRWWYFGHPLPNPYYKKGGAQLHLDGLLVALRAGVLFTFPFALLWIPALGDAALRRRALGFGLPIAGFTVIWVLLSSEMNYHLRFQYPIAVLTAMFWPALFVGLRGRATGWAGRLRDRAVGSRALVRAGIPLVVAAATVVGLVGYPAGPAAALDVRAEIGRALAPYAVGGHLVATTEAGLVPLESGWRAFDTWGLNDATVAHRGYLTAGDLDAADPLVVVTHPMTRPGPGHELWTAMTDTITTWARADGLRLVRNVPDGPDFTFGIWVRPGNPDSAALMWRLGCRTFDGVPDVADPSLAPPPCRNRP